jgi:4-hydroxyphenylpyruvate dioxygenase-like putative hemolysin
VDIELIEPDKNPHSTWRHDLDANGEGFHHIAFFIKGMKEKIEICGKAGFRLLQTGEYTGGRYAYIDANEKLKLVLELLEND